MPGDLDPAYVAARRALVDALEALEGQLQALVLVGAQAVYMHTGAAELAVAEYMTDGDIAIDPAALSVDPNLEEAMHRAGFELDLQQPGTWMSKGRIEIDLLVPESLGGSGRRGARLGRHGKRDPAGRGCSGRRPARGGRAMNPALQTVFSPGALRHMADSERPWALAATVRRYERMWRESRREEAGA